MSASKSAQAAEITTADSGELARVWPQLDGVETETADGMTTIRADGYTDEQIRQAWKVLRAGDPGTLTGRRRVAIVGFTGHREQAPFEDETWETWGLNNLHIYMPPGGKRPGRDDCYRWDAWFQLHTASEILNSGDQEHVDWLKADHGLPVLMFPDAVAAIASSLGAAPGEGAWWADVLPAVEPFPVDMVTGRYQHEYFTNSVAWMTGFAAMVLSNDHKLGVEGAEIGLWGVDMAVSSEYASQRPSCEFYLGVALGAGITITIPATSELLYTSTPYGVKEDRGYHMLAGRLEQLRSRRDLIRRRVAELDAEKHNMLIADGSHNGAIETLEHLIATQHIAPIDRNHAELFRSQLDAMTANLSS